MPIRALPKSQNAGLLLFRRRDDATQVLLGQAFPLEAIQQECGRAIIEEWAKGKKHRIWLTNKATEAIERR
jgi:hypothetical protein